MKVQFDTRAEAFQILSLEIDKLLKHAKPCHVMNQTAGIRLVKNDEEIQMQNTYPNVFHCARRISLCARRVTMPVACGINIRRFWLGKMCRGRNYEDVDNFFYKGQSKQFCLEEDANDFLSIFDRACAVDLVQEILLSHHQDGSFDHTIRIIIFRDELKEIINIRTRINGTLIEKEDNVVADTEITSVMKIVKIRIPLFKKPSYWSNEMNTFVLIGLESSM
eukprot:TCONS_00002945-protein